MSSRLALAAGPGRAFSHLPEAPGLLHGSEGWDPNRKSNLAVGGWGLVCYSRAASPGAEFTESQGRRCTPSMLMLTQASCWY